MIEYEYTGIETFDIGFRQISNSVRIHDVYLFLPASDDIIISAEDNKTSITAGVTGGATAETLQFSAMQNRHVVTNDVEWHLRVGNDYASAPVDGDIATISTTGLLTAGVDFEDDEEVWVFAEDDGKWSEGKKITIKKWEEPQLPTREIYNFSVAPLNTLSTSNFPTEVSLGGLTFGLGSNLLAQNATTGGHSFTHCLRTNGGASTTQRYVVIPLAGPAIITVYGASNNATANRLDVTSTVTSTVVLGTMAMPAWNNSALGTPTFDSNTVGPHTIVLKASASARIYMIIVDYQ